MITDSELKVKGMDVLISGLGDVEAEKFIYLMRRDSFDYTEWRKTLWPDLSVRELSSMAMKLRNANP